MYIQIDAVMKRIIGLVALLAVVALCVSCHGRKQTDGVGDVSLSDARLQLDTFSADRYLLLAHDEDSNGIHSDYTICWPRQGQLPDSIESRLVEFLFGKQYKASALSFAECCEAFLNDISLILMDDDDYSAAIPTPNAIVLDSFRSDFYHSTKSVSLDVIDLGQLVTFCRHYDFYVRGMPHGIYDCSYLTLDRATNRIVPLTDLMDTTDLGRVIRLAIDLPSNDGEMLRDCLFDPDKNLPTPSQFMIDSTRSNIIFVYGLYEIMPYACGIPSIVVPVEWLSKQVYFTPYAKELLLRQ